MRIYVNQISLYYQVSGNGVPTIMLHGNGEDHHIFDPLVSRLKHHYQVYAIDSRNHGQSSKTVEYAYEIMADDIYQLIQQLNLKKVNLIGFSDGAIISLMLAMKHEEVINKIVLLGVNLKPTDFTPEAYQYIKEIYQCTNDPLYKLMLEQPTIDLKDVRHINVPALIVAAEHDLFRPDTFENLAAALPKASLIIMQDHDHASYIVGQDILYEDLHNFLK